MESWAPVLSMNIVTVFHASAVRDNWLHALVDAGSGSCSVRQKVFWGPSPESQAVAAAPIKPIAQLRCNCGLCFCDKSCFQRVFVGID